MQCRTRIRACWQNRRVGLGGWIRHIMEADDGYEEDPDSVVTIGDVHPALAPLVVSALGEAGIRAESVQQRAAYRGPMRARVLCFARDRDAAAAIIDEMFADDETESTAPLD
jgi:hypothetical protein